MKTSTRMIDLIKQWEGLRLRAYLCAANVLTIGYGHTAGVKPGMKISQADADELFRQDLMQVEEQLAALASESGVTLTQGQFDALCSFLFNLGIGSLKGSTLWRKVCANTAEPTIVSEFGRWVYAGGKRLKGLEARRQTEAEFWEGGRQ